MSNMTWKDVVGLAEINCKKSGSKGPATNTAYLTVRSSHCRSTCRPAHKTSNLFGQKIDVIRYSAVYPIAMTSCISIPRSNDVVQMNGARSLVRIYTKFCVLLTQKAAIELILHDTSFANTCLPSVRA